LLYLVFIYKVPESILNKFYANLSDKTRVSSFPN
jgi:hypothetical protein